MEGNHLSPKNTVWQEVKCLAWLPAPSLPHPQLGPFGPHFSSQAQDPPCSSSVWVQGQAANWEPFLNMNIFWLPRRNRCKINNLTMSLFPAICRGEVCFGVLHFRFQWTGYYQLHRTNKIWNVHIGLLCKSSKGICCLMHMYLGLINWITIKPSPFRLYM